MFPLYYKLSLINYLLSLTGRSSVGERVLRNCQGRLRRELNVLSLLPYLNKYRLITADFHEELTLPATHAAKVDKLVAQLPKSGADFLERFIQCLRESVKNDPGTSHGQIADALEEELKIQITRGKSLYMMRFYANLQGNFCRALMISKCIYQLVLLKV